MLARHQARLAAAIVLTCEMPIETRVHKWKNVRLVLPSSSIDGLTFSVREIQRDVARFRQSIVAHHYPSHLR
jgi:hypothetical protein